VRVLPVVLVIRAGFVSREDLVFLLQFFSLEGTQLGVAKAARFPPSLPFLGRRSCVLILGEICFLKIVFCKGFSFFVLSLVGMFCHSCGFCLSRGVNFFL
jgi:hypothetical protein